MRQRNAAEKMRKHSSAWTNAAARCSRPTFDLMEGWHTVWRTVNKDKHIKTSESGFTEGVKVPMACGGMAVLIGMKQSISSDSSLHLFRRNHLGSTRTVTARRRRTAGATRVAA